MMSKLRLALKGSRVVVLGTALVLGTRVGHAEDLNKFTVAAPTAYVEAYKDALFSVGKKARPSSTDYLRTCCSALKGSAVKGISLRKVMRECSPRFVAQCVGLERENSSLIVDKGPKTSALGVAPVPTSSTATAPVGRPGTVTKIPAPVGSAIPSTPVATSTPHYVSTKLPVTSDYPMHEGY